MTAPTRLARAWRLFEHGLLWNLATALLLLALVVMLGEALSRLFLGRSYYWAEESVRFLVVWSFFLTLAVAGREGRHIRTSVLVDALPPALKRLADGLAALAGLVFALLLTYAAFQHMGGLWRMGLMTESNLDLPMWLVYACVPLSGILFSLWFAQALWSVLRGGRPFDHAGPTH
ncbi:MAG: TRAP transporter small permease [Pseudomonadota bacterium]